MLFWLAVKLLVSRFSPFELVLSVTPAAQTSLFSRIQATTTVGLSVFSTECCEWPAKTLHPGWSELRCLPILCELRKRCNSPSFGYSLPGLVMFSIQWKFKEYLELFLCVYPSSPDRVLQLAATSASLNLDLLFLKSAFIRILLLLPDRKPGPLQTQFVCFSSQQSHYSSYCPVDLEAILLYNLSSFLVVSVRRINLISVHHGQIVDILICFLNF